jgi:hypothetical protein
MMVPAFHATPYTPTPTITTLQPLFNLTLIQAAKQVLSQSPQLLFYLTPYSGSEAGLLSITTTIILSYSFSGSDAGLIYSTSSPHYNHYFIFLLFRQRCGSDLLHSITTIILSYRYQLLFYLIQAAMWI